jgi:transcriptional regulator with XRE-family HTH domain
MKTQPTLGDLIKHARREAGLTQEALAARAGLSARAISDLERNVSQTPRAATVQLLAEALALSAQEREHFETVARTSRARDEPEEQARTQPAVDRGAQVPELSPPLDLASRIPLVGRATEMAIVEQHLSGQGPPLLVVEGEPGVGKTRLLDEAAEAGAARGLKVLRGTILPTGRHVPRDPVVDAVRHVVETHSPVLLRRDLQGCAWLVRVLPELAFGPLEPLPLELLPAEQESVLIARAIVRFLTNTAGPGGVLLTLDDLHRADAPALERLAKLVQSANEVPLRIIGALRDGGHARGDALSLLLAWLAHEQHVRHLRLNPLSPDDSANLVRHVASQHHVNAAVVRRLVLDTGGVPFYLLACALDLERIDAERVADHVPWPIRQSVRARIAAVSGTGALLEAIAVAGGRASFPLLVAVSSQPEHEVFAALEAATREHLLEEDGQAYRFAYGVIRSAVEADLSHTRRVLLRQRFATALPSAGRGRRTQNTSTELDARAERARHLGVLRRHRERH